MIFFCACPSRFASDPSFPFSEFVFSVLLYFSLFSDQPVSGTIVYISCGEQAGVKIVSINTANVGVGVEGEKHNSTQLDHNCCGRRNGINKTIMIVSVAFGGCL